MFIFFTARNEEYKSLIVGNAVSNPATCTAIHMLCFSCIVYVLLWKGVGRVGRVIRRVLSQSTAVTVEICLGYNNNNHQRRGNTCTQLRRYLSWPSVDTVPLKQGDRNRQIVLATRKRRPFRYIESRPAGTFRIPWPRCFPCFFPQL